ncbi:MAG: proA 4 [Clostridiales bacterium]|jgi:regulator of RNase E activity RraA|nr:proA 4 [Clostridiales bacterium]
MSEVNIKEFPELISDEIIERTKKLCPTLLCDGMKGLGIPMEGCMDAQIKPVEMSMKVIGTAITVDTDNGDNFPIHLATYAGKPGYVMVIDGKGYKDKAYFGDLIIGAAKAVGLKGMIIDGYSRDREGTIEVGLPVFSKGFMPRGPIKKNPGKINGTIMCGGVQVNPGDLIMGDADGVAVVQRDRIEEVLAAAEEKLAYEVKRVKTIKAYEDALAKGSELPQLAPQWVLDLLAGK